MPDIFGDLREWGRVIEQIGVLTLAGELDQHQEGLTRVLRYRYNWQLRQAALHSVSGLKKPSRELFDVLLGIVTDEYCEMDTRLLACEAVRYSISRHHAGDGYFAAEAARRASELLRVPQPPVLRRAVQECLVVTQEAAAQHA